LAEHFRARRTAIDVYDIHGPRHPDNVPNPGDHGVPNPAPIVDGVDTIEQAIPPSPGERLFPPLLVGDINISGDKEINDSVSPGGVLEDFDILAYSDYRDVVGMLVGKGRIFPSRFGAQAVTNLILPRRGPGLCGTEPDMWSDHCAQYAELELTPAGVTPLPPPPPGPLPTVPRVVGKTPAAARDALQKAGFRVRQYEFVDRDCERVGYVYRQNPTAGTQMEPGETVRIWIYVPPPIGCP